MNNNSYTFGELKKRLQESASEFKPVIGKGVEASNKANNRKAYGEIKKDSSLGNVKQSGQSVLAAARMANNGMGDWQYDGINDKAKKDIVAGIEGYTSDQDKNARKKDEQLGNASREGNKKTLKDIKDTSRGKVETRHKRAEAGLKSRELPPEEVHLGGESAVSESKKIDRFKFKKVQFLSENHMLSHVPDEYKVDGKRFQMQDCKGNKYLVEWHEKPYVEKMLNESAVNEELSRIKHLFDYQTKDTRTTNSMMTNENARVDDMLGRMRKLMK